MDHYAEFMLRQVAENSAALDRMEFVQAILQHYGWRSFYLDLSASPAVAAYFAGWQWTSNQTMHMVEDCFEDPVFALHDVARYIPAAGDAHFYVISRQALKETNLGFHDLSQLTLWTGGTPRYLAQQAWLAGPLNGDLPIKCLLSHIVGPASVFREFANSQFEDVNDLFPNIKADVILHMLLSLPWVEIVTTNTTKSSSIKFFRRALEVPEYQEANFEKHQPTNVAYFCGAKVAGIVEDQTLHVRSAPGHIIFGSYDGPPIFPRVTELVRRHKRVVFEVDELIWLPETMIDALWGKGLWVEEQPDGMLQVGDFVVTHPGQQLTGYGALAMWRYKADAGGRWMRSPSKSDCPCQNTWRHQSHLSALGVLEHELGRAAGPA